MIKRFLSLSVLLAMLWGCTQVNEDTSATEEKTASYKVEHYQQNANDDDYTLVEADTEYKTGTTDADTSAQAKTYEGFTAQEVKQVKIAADGSSVVKIYYDRKIITLTLKPIKRAEEKLTITGKYGATVNVTAPTKSGYEFACWNPQLPETFPAESATYTATWAVGNGTAYKVEHYQQNITDDEYTLADTENKTGTTDADTSAQAKTYEGFTAKTVEQVKITADGSAVVKIYYDRNEITLTLNLDGGEGENEITGKYGANVTTPANPTKSGYDFAGWNPELPETFPAESATYKAKFLVKENFILVQGATITNSITDSDIFDGSSVTVSGFHISDHEVTQAEYEKYCSYGGSKPSEAKGDGDNYPAYYVSWYDALVYCNKRSIAEGLTPCYTINDSTNPDDWGDIPTSASHENWDSWRAVTCDFTKNGYRLPTEAEWEYAARGGNGLTGTQYTYAGSNTIGDVAWYKDNSDSKTHPVKGKEANGLGLHDMTGNVWEWFWVSNDSGSRYLRGGSWDVSEVICAVSSRYSGNAYIRYMSFGFRVVRTAD